jgi:hypothetical protein
MARSGDSLLISQSDRAVDLKKCRTVAIAGRPVRLSKRLSPRAYQTVPEALSSEMPVITSNDRIQMASSTILRLQRIQH